MAEATAQEIAQGLGVLRRRRWQLWSVFITYLPAVGLSLRLSGSDTVTLAVALVWLALAAVAGVRVSFSRCPRCGELFHMAGFATVWGRRCLHCKLGLKPTRSGA